MLFYATIEAGTLDLLKSIQGLPEMLGTRLVGGTALALQIGHRKSIDLDFFGDLTIRALELEQTLREIGKTSLVDRSKLIEVYHVCGVKVDFVDYAYPWLQKSVEEDELRLASVDDIAAMKLSAITNRGTKKDFIDLFFLLRKYTMEQMFQLYSEKYSDSNVFPVIKSLTWFEDAEDEPMPVMIEPCEWETVKARIIDSVASFLK